MSVIPPDEFDRLVPWTYKCVKCTAPHLSSRRRFLFKCQKCGEYNCTVFYNCESCIYRRHECLLVNQSLRKRVND